MSAWIHFVFVGGVYPSGMGQCLLFETNNDHAGDTMNHYCLLVINDDILVVFAGRFTPRQKEIVCTQA